MRLTIELYTGFVGSDFNPRIHIECDVVVDDLPPFVPLFQSTHSYRMRPPTVDLADGDVGISIHAFI